MPAMKRHALSPMKTAKKNKVVDQKIKELHEILTDKHCDVPGTKLNRNMLVTGLSFALTSASDERHPYQATLAKNIGEVMSTWVAKHEQKVADTKAALDDTAASKATAEAERDEAKKVHEAQEKVVQNAQDSLSEARDKEEEAAAALEAANTEVINFDKDKIVKVHQHYTKVFEVHFQGMKGAETPDAKSHLSEVVLGVKEMMPDEAALHLAIAPALKKADKDRGNFDKATVAMVESAFKKKIETLTAEISNFDNAKSVKEATAANLKEAHDVTVAKRDECKAALNEAGQSLREKEKALKEKEKTFSLQTKAAEKAQHHKDSEQQELDCAKGNLSSYLFLLERTTPVEEDPPADAAEEVSASAEA